MGIGQANEASRETWPPTLNSASQRMTSSTMVCASGALVSRPASLT